MNSAKVNNCVLVVVAHPDDETIGMGGTIARHVKEGDEVFGVCLTNGVSSRDPVNIAESAIRAENAELAAAELGFTWTEKLDFPDNSLDTVPLLKLIKAIEKVKNQVRPSLVYTHHIDDLNIDHKLVAQATLTAFRPQPNELCSEIRSFEVASATDFGGFDKQRVFLPNLYIDVLAYMEKKNQALKHYGAEIKPAPHSRSNQALDAQASYRGASVGLEKAEAFQIIRKIFHG